MPHPSRAEEYLGKTIEGIIVNAHRGRKAGARPVMQVILSFTDGTSGEIYSNPDGSIALAHVTVCRHEEYRVDENAFEILYRRLRRAWWRRAKLEAIRSAKRAKRMIVSD